MSLRDVVTVVGTGIGFLVGYPALGYALGSMVGNLIDPQTIQGPRIGEIQKQTAQEGGPIPIVFGLSPPIAGNVIASSEPEIVTETSGGKGGPEVESESVYRTYAIGVCEGPVSGFARIWRNNKLVFDTSADSILTDAENDQFLEKARFFLGSYDQDASSDLEAVFGAGTTAAHRGIAYMVMANENVTDMAGAIPQWTFQMGMAQSSEILAFGSSGLDRSTDGGLTWSHETPSVLAATILDAAYNGSRIIARRNTGALYYSDDKGVTWTAVGSPPAETGFSVGPIFWSEAHELWICLSDSSTASGKVAFYSTNGLSWTATPTAALSHQPCRSVIEVGSAIYAFFQTMVAVSLNGISWTITSMSSSISGPMQTAYDANNSRLVHCSGNTGMRYSAIGSPQTISIATGFVSNEATVAWSDELGLATTHPGVPRYTENGVSWALGGSAISGYTEYHTIWSSRARRFVACGISTGPFVRIATSDDGINWTVRKNTGAYTPRFLLDVGGFSTAATERVMDIVSAIASRCGVEESQVDVSGLAGLETYGFMVTNQYSASQALAALGQIFNFDSTNADGKIVFVPRGGASVVSATEDDMVDDDSEIEQHEKRADAIVIPRVLNLNYYAAVAGALATSKQTSERTGDRRASGDSSIQTPVLLTDDAAAQAVSIIHKVMIEIGKGELKFALPDNFLFLTTTDPITVNWQGRSERAVISSEEMLDGYQQYTLVRDRQSAYTSNATGLPTDTPTPPPSPIVGATLIQPLDIHILRDADDNVGLGYYIAVSGQYPAWAGCVVELSRDGGANYTESQAAAAATVMGELISGLTDAPQSVPDTTNSFQVRLGTPGAVLQDSDLAGMMNRANLAAIGSAATGWELINFAEVAEDDPEAQEWTVSNLLRGRKGTDPVAHSAGAKFVLLTRSSLFFVPASIADIGKTLTFRATSFGRPTSEGTVVSMTFAGLSQTERQPAYLTAYRDGSNLVVAWQGVGRLGAGAQVAHGARFDGYRVVIDGSSTITVDTDEQTTTQDVGSLGSNLTVSVYQRNQLTGLGPEAQVMVV